MSEKEYSGGAQRAKEDDFFYKQERELIERMRSQAEAGATLRQLAEITGIGDEALLRDLQGHGFSPQTVRLLELAPLVLVAWSDGSVTLQEKREISLVARLHGFGEGIPGYGHLVGWLETRPSDEFFRVTLRGIRAVLEALPGEERQRRERELLSRCTQVAKVSGGFLGMGSRISAPERVAILRVAAQLGAREADQGTEAGELS
jgi:hypothetical protein